MQRALLLFELLSAEAGEQPDERVAKVEVKQLVAVALANKMARIAFAIMRGRTTYSAAPV